MVVTLVLGSLHIPFIVADHTFGEMELTNVNDLEDQQPVSQDSPDSQGYSQKIHAMHLQDASKEDISEVLNYIKNVTKPQHVTVKFRNLSLWTVAPEPSIPTVLTTLASPICGTGKKRRIDILKNLNGCLEPYRMTLLLGPPGSGRSGIYYIWLICVIKSTSF